MAAITAAVIYCWRVAAKAAVIACYAASARYSNKLGRSINAMTIPEAIRNTLKQGRADNSSSWRWVVAFFESVTSLRSPYGERLQPLLRLVQQLASSQEAQLFRAGQSLHDLLISTKESNGLTEDDPYIRVAAEWKTPTLRVEYWRGDKVGDMVEGYSVSESQLLETLKPLLARLYSDTREPGE